MKPGTKPRPDALDRSREPALTHPMTDRPAPPAPVIAALMRAFLRVVPANVNDRYDERLNGFPPACPRRELWPAVTLDPDVGVELRRAMMEVVR